MPAGGPASLFDKVIGLLGRSLMAKTLNVILTDDTDGSSNAVTVAFGYQNSFYEIDLTPQNKAGFAEVLAPFIAAARRTPAGTSPRPRRTAADRRDSATIRAWARDQGLDISDRGRISPAVISQYRATH
jgi:hypothetical protein